MEVVLPIVAIGGMYILSNRNNRNNNNEEPVEEGLENLGANVKINEMNFIKSDLKNDINNLDKTNLYINPRQTTDKFFENVIYEGEMNDDMYIESMSGQNIRPNDFQHNNMQPFFGAKLKGQLANFNSNEQKLDNMTGTGSQLIKKQEQAPLFKPHDNFQYTHGVPNQSDFYQSRVNPSLKMSNIKPWQEERVAPGLNLGYNNNGANNSLEERSTYMPKNVDDMRVVTNPKTSYSLDGHMGPANSYLMGQVGNIGKVEKKLPDASYENTKDRWLTTTGSYLKDSARPVFNNKVENRSTTSVSYDGIAHGGKMGVNYDETTYQQSQRPENCAPEFTPASYTNGTNLGTSSYNILKNNRSYDIKNPNTEYFGDFGSAIGAVVSPLLDVLKPSKKENVIGNIRIHGEVQTHVPQSYLPNQDDIRITNRQMQTHSQNHLNVQNQGSGAYMNADYEDVGAFRDDNSKEYYGGGTSSYGQLSHLSADNQICNTSKNSTVHNRVPNGNAQNKNEHLSSKQVCVRSDGDRLNNRMWVPNQPGAALTPCVEHGGAVCNNQSYQEKNNDRISADILEAFKANPFTHSLNSVA